MNESASRPTVIVALWEGVELLDWAGPFEVFARARVGGSSDERAFDVRTVTTDGNAVRSQELVSITPDHSIDDCPRADILVIPGANTHNARDDERFMAWAAKACGEAGIVLSVCTGALVLADLGVLDGLRATTHHLSLGILRELAPSCDVVEGERVVDNGRIVTTAGVSAGIDGALHVVARTAGAASAEAAASIIEWEWDGEGAEGQRGRGAEG